MSWSKKKHYNITKLFEQFFVKSESKSTFVGETKRKKYEKKINLIPCITLTEAAFII